MNDAYRSVTFDDIEPGASAELRRTLSLVDVEALAMVSGDIVPFQLADDAPLGHGGLQVDAVAAEALVSGLVERKLPGPGSVIVAQELRFDGQVAVGDDIRVSITVREKHPAERLVVFDCEACVGEARLLWGRVTVRPPDERVTVSDVATPAFILRRTDVFARLLRRCEPLEAVRCAVVHPCDRESLLGALEAARRGLIVPVLVGPEARIRSVAAANGADLGGLRIVPTEHSHAAAAEAVAMARRGDVECLMKGSLHTEELMSAVVAGPTGLRTERRVSHVFVMDVPAYDRVLLVTDAAINIEPSLPDKADILRNAIDLAHVLGIEQPRAAIVCAVATVSPGMRSTVDAAALCKMADRGQITGAVVDGPLAFDNAISEIAARSKSIRSPVAGRADILLVPDIEAGNMLAKQLQYFAGADSAGIVLGARVPVILTSRADNVRMRIASSAVAKLIAHSRRAAGAAGAAR